MKCEGCGEMVYEAYDCRCDEVVLEQREKIENLKDIIRQMVAFDPGCFPSYHGYSSCPGNEDRGCLGCRIEKAYE